MSTNFSYDLTPAIESSAKPESEKKRLMLAVLEEALMTFQKGLASAVPEQRKHAYEVETWVASQDCDWPFAFENVCSCLDIDPDYVRSRMKRVRRKALVSRKSRAAGAGQETVQPPMHAGKSARVANRQMQLWDSVKHGVTESRG